LRVWGSFSVIVATPVSATSRRTDSLATSLS
jgi:hypothetical protein